MKTNFSDALKKDQLLTSLAMYDVTKGMLIMPADVDTVIEMQKQIVRKFNYFKKQIQCGETTLEDLSESISYKNGAFKQDNTPIEKIAEDIVNIESKNEKDKNIKEGTYRLLQEIFKDVIESQYKSPITKEQIEEDKNVFQAIDNIGNDTEKEIKPLKPSPVKTKKNRNNV